MAARPALIKQADASRLLKAARSAGFSRARIITHPDGRFELVAENGSASMAEIDVDEWADCEQ